MRYWLSNRFIAFIAFAAVSVSVLSPAAMAQKAGGGRLKETREVAGTTKNTTVQSPLVAKISPELLDRADQLANGFAPDVLLPVIIEMAGASSIDTVLGSASATGDDEDTMVREEIEKNQQRTGILLTDLAQAGGTFEKSHDAIGLISARLPLSRVRQLAQSDNVAYISADRETEAYGHIAETTGFWNTGINDAGDADPNTWMGGGVSIAVIDSGIDTNHRLMKWTHTDGSTSSKVWSYDFTGQGVTDDRYGHGTHVASLIAGEYFLDEGAYNAPAAGSQIISLRALDENGRGRVSNAIAAIDWVVQQKVNGWWNIRIINISFGTPAVDSYLNDPLCKAARRAVNAGIVVVASAGNSGKSANGTKLFGTINSPGIEPSVITVGAANTFGTTNRNDDTVATFSSRGPTRGYRTLSNGARKYDNLIKPDLVAPGNRILGARSATNKLIQQYPALAAGSATNPAEKVMYLSGTSMATPVVSAAAALLIETNPNLTPNLIKAILMYSAQPLKNFNTLEQGAGLLNIDGAVRLARLVKPTMPTTNGGALLNSALPAAQTSIIGGQTVYWSKGVITNFGFLQGNDLMNKWQGMYAQGVLISDSTPFSGVAIAKNTSMTTPSPIVYQGAIKNNGVLISDGVSFLTSLQLGGTPLPILSSTGVLVSDGVLISDGVLVSDGVLISDGVLVSDGIIGDNTAAMLPAR